MMFNDLLRFIERQILEKCKLANGNILIFCPSLYGHRQNYSYVISNFFLSKGYTIVLAAGENGNLDRFGNYPLVQQLLVDPRVKLVDLGVIDGTDNIAGRWIHTVLDLEKKYLPVLTIFPTADEMRITLEGLGKFPKKETFRRVGIFIYTNYLYKTKVSSETIITKSVRLLKWILLFVKDHYYYNYNLWNRLGLNSAFATNPDFMNIARSSKYHYLPEIYKAWNDDIDMYSDAIDNLCKSYNTFLAKHAKANVILYYGGRAARRGYDVVMKLACDDPDSVFVSCGRFTSDDCFQHDVKEMRDQLGKHGRFFEVEIPFYPDNKFVDLLYNSCNFVLLPYNNFNGMSGTMIQATTYGKPVIVPNTGYMKSMVDRHKIGITYAENNYDDLLSKYMHMKAYAEEYVGAVYKFANMHGKAHITSALSKILPDQRHQETFYQVIKFREP